MPSRLVLLALLALVVGACAALRDDAARAGSAAPSTATLRTTTASTGPARQPPPGLVAAAERRPAPELRVTAYDGRTVTLEGMRGGPAVVSFFESWCPICQVEQPDLSRVAAEFAGGVGFVGVSYHDTADGGRAYQRRFHVPYPLANDASGRTWARWRVPYQPVVLVDKQGRIAGRFEGGTTGGTLRAALAYLVGE